jgi:hypothetical protein
MDAIRAMFSRFWVWLKEPEPKPDTYRIGDDEQPPAYRDDGVATGGTTGNVGGFGDVGP